MKNIKVFAGMIILSVITGGTLSGKNSRRQNTSEKENIEVKSKSESINAVNHYEIAE